MSQRCIYDNGRCCIFQNNIEGNSLVITFGHVSKYRMFWGGNFLTKRNVPAIGIADYSRSWYAPANASSAFDYIEPIVSRFSRVVLYGHSMGAYAALKYGSRLNADIAISLSPQHSIAPEDVWRFDKERSDQFYRPELHAGMRVRQEDLPGKSLVFFDPRFRIDRWHARRLLLLENIFPVAVPFAGHQVTKYLIETGTVWPIISAALSRDLSWKEARTIIRRARCGSERYDAAINGRIMRYASAHQFQREAV